MIRESANEVPGRNKKGERLKRSSKDETGRQIRSYEDEGERRRTRKEKRKEGLAKGSEDQREVKRDHPPFIGLPPEHA